MLSNKRGLHLRAAVGIVRIASRHDCLVLVGFNDSEVNSKSIIGLLRLAVSHGMEVTLTVNGAKATEAMGEIQHLFNDKFGEEN